jgi:hypothetical protein
VRPVTAPQPDTPGTRARRRRRDLFAVVLLLFGVGNIVAAAALTDYRLGVAAVGVLLITAGVVAGLGSQ